MSDDLSKRGAQDRSRINTSEDYEVRYWSKKQADAFQSMMARR